MNVSDVFVTFCNNLRVDPETRTSISARYKRITKQLNIDYYGSYSDTDHSRYVGSYGRNTATKGFSDLDMIFQLPDSVYTQFNRYIGNSQSALLQQVRTSLRKTYSTTDISGDGQVIVICFSDNITFEIVPAFINDDNGFIYPDAKNGGCWRITNPIPEIQAVAAADTKHNGNLKNLCKMARAWKAYCHVPMGGLLIDTLACTFLSNWQHRNQSYYYYDWLSRDFFWYLSQQNPLQNYWYAIGSNQHVYRKGLFEAKAKKAYNLSVEAIVAEGNGRDYTSKSKWREIYGPRFPL
jgi:hypothetical protein